MLPSAAAPADPDDRRFDADDKRQATELIELEGGDLRREPLAVRKTTLASLLRFKTKFKVESTGGRYPRISSTLG